MKLVSMNLNREGLVFPKGTADQTDVQLITGIFDMVIMSYAEMNRGLTFAEQRMFYRMWTKIDAIRNQNGDVQLLPLDDAWYAFLMNCIQKAKVPPSVLLNRVVDLLEAAKDG